MYKVVRQLLATAGMETKAAVVMQTPVVAELKVAKGALAVTAAILAYMQRQAKA
jgi:hypothetical protein